MRYEKGYKETTRKHIVEIAARRFRKDGIDSVGLAKLMKDAGLTHGGFYNHFKSKEDLIAQSLRTALEKSIDELQKKSQAQKGRKIEALLENYLHPLHAKRPDKGCAIAAVGGEISRRPESTKKVFRDQISRFFSLIESLLPEEIDDEQKKKISMAMFSTMVGALQLSRMMSDKEQSLQILQSGIDGAMGMIKTA